jgi:hypothetical protein
VDLTHLYCVAIDRVDVVKTKPNTDEHDDRFSTLISCGDEDNGWADVMPCTSV